MWRKASIALISPAAAAAGSTLRSRFSYMRITSGQQGELVFQPFGVYEWLQLLCRMNHHGFELHLQRYL